MGRQCQSVNSEEGIYVFLENFVMIILKHCCHIQTFRSILKFGGLGRHFTAFTYSILLKKGVSCK